MSAAAISDTGAQTCLVDIPRWDFHWQQSYAFREGEIVNIDVTLIVDGWHGDTSRMFPVGRVGVKAQKLLDVTYEALMLGIEEVRPGATREGSPRWACRLEVAEGEYAGRTAAWDSLVFSERGLPRVAASLLVRANMLAPHEEPIVTELVSALDLTISVCTAVVHLSGALGRPVWVLAPDSPEWRYGRAGAGMPWYPSARVFRQARHGDWDSVLNPVGEKLRELSRSPLPVEA